MNFLVCVIDPTIELLFKHINHLASAVVNLTLTRSALSSWCLALTAAGMPQLFGGQHRH
jgi:hypothetical protein